jgi:hypothetical protein
LLGILALIGLGALTLVVATFARYRAISIAVSVLAASYLLFSWARAPCDVGYEDVLTRGNERTFVAHHKWGDDWTEYGNTGYAESAIKRLGPLAYGRTFGNLMDDQKRFEEKRRESVVSANTSKSSRSADQAPRTCRSPGERREVA